MFFSFVQVPSSMAFISLKIQLYTYCSEVPYSCMLLPRWLMVDPKGSAQKATSVQWCFPMRLHKPSKQTGQIQQKNYWCYL